ncbi:MAG TPA: amidohydrolase family protein [Anaerohalosphaeraceae bacterium]|nr:amidohydrolase family protein [Anaerohalosphaeraceae bacterium]HRT49598.1 amidohydrolase family protein [Anaerohalosphaeraceae bacterium]HRT85467.1 amidohydrolase family protein [Anaerohalosphaeraceae bacterium]
MKGQRNVISRRSTLKGIGAVGAMGLLQSDLAAADGHTPTANAKVPASEVRRVIAEKVNATPLIDTHEHLIEEKGRFSGHSHVRSDDWSVLLSHYLDSDLITAGMPQSDHRRFFSPDVEPADKFKLIEPYWPAVKDTGYGQAVRIACRKLYDVDDIRRETIGKIQAGYERIRKPGFYKHILCESGNIESCQVNSLEGTPFMQSAQPTLLMQDISIVGMFAGPDIGGYAGPAGIEVTTLADWHRVIDWWFGKYGKYAVAVKSQNAYGRDIDYARVEAGKVEEVFTRRLAGQPLSGEHGKALEDHLFWYAVEKATEYNLPIKLHTGYYAGQNYMPLSRLISNAGSACELCRNAPRARFVFMHICYPYYEELIAVAKQWANAYVDMCWSWIINPAAAKDFLKKYLVTAPANKILTFGGDYIPVEPVIGHAAIARRGITLALAELVEEGWMTLDDAIEKADMIMHGNARRIFDLGKKEAVLKEVTW